MTKTDVILYPPQDHEEFYFDCTDIVTYFSTLSFTDRNLIHHKTSLRWEIRSREIPEPAPTEQPTTNGGAA